MENPVPSHELTTTLHLGVRSVVDSSPIALIEKLIAESSAEETAILQEVMNGTGENAMVFIHRGPSRGARFLITAEGSTIGRAPASDIFLDDVTVSRAHATIKRDGEGFLFTDSGSLNGSYINNQQTSSHRLSTGDEIQIGKFHMLFICSNKAQSQSGEK
jgi:pSer/pThr/pTyr-binding forkhead associated (FHA) protein